MRRLTQEELLPRAAWEAVRADFREALIRHKQPRRVGVGDRVTVVFEDRETLRWQVQEMARVEGLQRPEQLQAELDVYNELVPGDGELSATLFIEITDAHEIRPELDRLIGIDEHVALLLGEGAGARRVPARFDAKQLDEERIAAVQYLRFALTPEERALLADPAAPAVLAIDHPAYARSARLAPETRASLARDLEGGAPPLLDLEAARTRPAPAPTADEVVEDAGPVRVVRPARPAAPAHLVVEATDPGATFLDADDALRAALLAAVARHARRLGRQHGSCHLRAELSGPLRWHLLAGGS